MTREQQETERALLISIASYLEARGWIKEGPFWKQANPKLCNLAGLKPALYHTWEALVETRASPLLFGGGLR